jgi:hypothetical protein
MMRSALICTLAGVICAASWAKNSNFEGKWELEANQSTATSPIPDGLQEQIKQKGSEMMIQSRWHEPANGITPLLMLGVMVSELRLNTDGSQTRSQIGPFAAATTTRQDGDSSVKTDWQATVNGQSVTGYWVRTLSSDGKNMTLDIQQQSSDGKTGTAKLVFKRK